MQSVAAHVPVRRGWRCPVPAGHGWLRPSLRWEDRSAPRGWRVPRVVLHLLPFSDAYGALCRSPSQAGFVQGLNSQRSAGPSPREPVTGDCPCGPCFGLWL